MLSCGLAKQANNLNSNEIELTKEIELIVRGRVVDGLISGATVFIDLNNNGVKDFDEPTGVTDESGFYSISENIDVPTGSIIIATGGIDTITGEDMGSNVLIFLIPGEKIEHIQVSPITTILASLGTEKKNKMY